MRPLWDRAAEWRCRLGMIERAREFLYASTFYIEVDRYGDAFLDALEAAQRRGVAVTLVNDGFGQLLGGTLMTRAERRRLADRLAVLRQAGATVTTYRPRHLLQRRLGGGQHVKIQLSETGEAIFGSSNITKTSFEGWNEYSVALRGPVVQVLARSLRDIGADVPEAHLARLATAGASTMPDGDIHLDYVACNPNLHQGLLGPLFWSGRNPVTERMRGLVDAARSTIQLTSFFFKPVPPLMRAVIEAGRRGVRVEVFHSHRDTLPATDLAWIAAAAGYERLLAAGVRLYENRRGEHSKIVLVDHETVAFGSYNFEHAAHDRLAEAMLVTTDRRVVRATDTIFENLRRDRDHVRVTRARLRALPARLRVRRAVLGPLRRWM